MSILYNRWQAWDRVQRTLLILMIVRVLLSLLLMLNVFPLELRYKWHLHHGGDQDAMMSLARSIIAGEPERALVGIGAALAMIPWILLLEPQNYYYIVAPLVVINGFLFGGLSVFLIGNLTRRVSANDKMAIASATIWALLPLLVYYGFFWHSDPVILRSSYVPMFGWLNGLSDGPATFFLMISAALLSRGLNEGKSQPFWRMAGVGAAISVAVMYRIHVALIGGGLLLYVLLAHGWRNLGIVCVAGLATYSPQAWYNQIMFGFPITSGYVSYWGSKSLMEYLRSLPYHPQFLADTWNYIFKLGYGVVALLGLALALNVYAVAVLWKRGGWKPVMLLAGPAVIYLGAMASTWIFQDDLLRFMMPALPFLLILGIFACWEVGQAIYGRVCVNRGPAKASHASG